MELIEIVNRLGGREEFCRRSVPIIVRGEILRDFFVLTRGAAVAEYRVGRAVCSVTLGPGDFFGERCLLPGASDATVRPAVDGTEAMALDVEALRSEMEADPATEALVRERLAARLFLLEARLRALRPARA